MEIRVVKFDIPYAPDASTAGLSATRTVTVDANGHSLPAGDAKAVVCVSNGADSQSGTTGTSDHLTGSVGFGRLFSGTESSAGHQSSCVSYYSLDNVGTTVAQRRTLNGISFVEDPTGVGFDHSIFAERFYAEVATVKAKDGYVEVLFHPVGTGRGGTVVYWIVYGADVLVEAGRGITPHNTAQPKKFTLTFNPTLIFFLAGDTAVAPAWAPASYAAEHDLSYPADTDAAMSLGIATANTDGTGLSVRSLAWRDSSGVGTSASGLYFSDDYAIVGDVSSAGATSSPILLESVGVGSVAGQTSDGFTLDLRSGAKAFPFAYLALRSELTTCKLQTFATPTSTGYANQDVSDPVSTVGSVFMIQTQVPSVSVDTGMTNPVSATWGIGMGHQTTTATDPVSYSVGFQVEDNAGTSDTQSSWATQLGYLVKKHGAAATVSNFDWVTHAAGSADPASVDWVTNTTATGVTNRQWAGLFISNQQVINLLDWPSYQVGNVEVWAGNSVSVEAPFDNVLQTIVLEETLEAQVFSLAVGNPHYSVTVSYTDIFIAASVSSLELIVEPAIEGVKVATGQSQGSDATVVVQPVAAESFGAVVASTARVATAEATVVSTTVASWARTDPVAATAVVDIPIMT